MELRPLKYHELSSISTLQPERWGDIKPNFEFYIKSPFCFPIKLIINNKIVAVGTTVVHNDVAWLAHIIVHSENRGKGLGRIITQNLIDIANQKKCKTIYLIATDLGFPVYEKLGFVTETDYLFFKDVNIKDQMFDPDTIKPYAEKYKDRILKIDRSISGEDRRIHIENQLKNGFVYCKDETVEGYYLPCFGEGLIISNTPLAGIELLKLHLKSNQKVVLPKDNSTAIDFLYENGYKEFSTAKRMRLGSPTSLMLKNIYNRIGGNIG